MTKKLKFYFILVNWSVNSHTCGLWLVYKVSSSSCPIASVHFFLESQFFLALEAQHSSGFLSAPLTPVPAKTAPPKGVCSLSALFSWVLSVRHVDVTSSTFSSSHSSCWLQTTLSSRSLGLPRGCSAASHLELTVTLTEITIISTSTSPLPSLWLCCFLWQPLAFPLWHHRWHASFSVSFTPSLF